MNVVNLVGMVGAGLVPAQWAHRAGTSPAPTIPTWRRSCTAYKLQICATRC